jgi:hypothetical protein
MHYLTKLAGVGQGLNETPALIILLKMIILGLESRGGRG